MLKIPDFSVFLNRHDNTKKQEALQLLQERRSPFVRSNSKNSNSVGKMG